MREFIYKLWDLFHNLGVDEKWRDMINYVGGPWMLIAVLFAVIFVETGFVIMPFLPGDSLLFALGAIGSRDVGIPLLPASILLIVAAILGDAVNYAIGAKIGPAVFNREDSKLLNKKHLLRAHEFYEKYGAKTIILARFIPIIRTFAPFVAGIGKMSYPKFFVYNAVGAVLWITICVGSGVLFGQMEFVKKNFELVLVAIVCISVLPMIIEFLRERAKAKANAKIPGEEAIVVNEDKQP